jgi:hypothetical protein
MDPGSAHYQRGLSHRQAAALIGLAAALYVAAAWMVAPGFYDGFPPPEPYNWVCPPSVAGGGNIPPASGHLDLKVIDGVSDAGSAFTKDTLPQIVIGFLPGAFEISGKSTISIDITPLVPCPSPAGVHFATNTYLITASAPLVKDANLKLVYSAIVPAPSSVYFATSPDGPWRDIGALQQAQPFTIDTSTKGLGYFAAGYPSTAIQGGSTSQLLPIVVAVLIVGVLVAGIPLTFLRRRHSLLVGTDEESIEEQ